MNIVPIVPDSALGEGNIIPPLTKQISPSKRWCFTLNNYLNKDIEQISALCASFCKYAIIGKEVGDSGTPHLQGYLEFKERKRPKSVFSYTDKIYWTKSKGSKEENYFYCSKQEIVFELGGKKKLRKLACEGNLYDWQKLIVSIIKEQPSDRIIYWFRGKQGGEGKTEFCKYLVRFHSAHVSGGKCADMKNSIVEYEKSTGDYPELIVMNIPRSFNEDYLSYTGIEEVKDMCFYSGKYEGGMVEGNRPHLFIFANCFPDFKKCSNDRWKIYDINYKGWISIDDIDHSDDEYIYNVK